MNLPHIVHTGHQHHPPQQETSGPGQSLSAPHARLIHAPRQDMASAVVANPYISQSTVYTRPPRPPPSPPLDDLSNLRTLPSIQSLIGMDGSASNQDTKRKLLPCQPGLSDLSFVSNLIMDIADTDRNSSLRKHPAGEMQSTGQRPQKYGQPTVSHPTAAPPSPPIDPQLGFDGPNQSPPATSSHSSATGAQYAGGAFMGNSSQQHPPPPSSQPGAMPPPSSQSPYQNSGYPETSSTGSAYAYPPPAVSGPQSMFYQGQRPLPTAFPPNVQGNANPATPASSEASPIDPNNPQWQHQHHHYISPSASASFPGQTQDRYVCQVCNKAFSRPSSLKIHSHSHTGEKPFLCPHKGCGKAFSVRSNMKRHERGCHGGGASPEAS